MRYQIQLLVEKLAEDRVQALKFAASLSGGLLGNHRDAIQRGWAARSSPSLYQEMGVDPVEAERSAYQAMDELISAERAAD